MALAEDEKSKEKSGKKSSSFVRVEKKKVDLRKKEEPLVDIKVTNPIRYLKSWWRKIIGNEGIELRLKVRPLTAIAIAIIVVTVSLGIGKFNFPFKIPFFEYTTKEVVTGKVSKRDAAFTGVLRFETNQERYYLITESSEAIKLSVKEDVNLDPFIGRRIFATGDYYQESRTLTVDYASDLEVLPEEKQEIPTIVPSPIQVTPEEDSNYEDVSTESAMF
ncbi:MAG: hypothetical protein PVJ52_01690 [Candidatus Woesebacteria bacterium]|jgi:hypothetical protein